MLNRVFRPKWLDGKYMFMHHTYVACNERSVQTAILPEKKQTQADPVNWVFGQHDS